ncbi:hypothetical protein TNCV_2184731 [Trichonephila clavipes]|nr:hypothetical protein TNCV_2184731 [Trichonephila clavipes]
MDRENRHFSIIARRKRGGKASQISRYMYASIGTRLSIVTVSKIFMREGCLSEDLLFASRLHLRLGESVLHFADNIEIGVWINGRSFYSPMSPVSA